MTNILVTGTSRGIGKSIAQSLNKRGCKVFGHSSKGASKGAASKGDGQTRANENNKVNGNGEQANTEEFAADFRNPAQITRLWEQELDHANGQINVLIHNAGLFAANPIDQSEDEWLAAWNETLQINLAATAQLSRLAISHWLHHGERGRIVFIASRAGHRGDSPAHWHYAASKGGMLALHKTIARAYAAKGITSLAIAPGFTDTAMADDYLASRGGPALLADIPLGRVAQPEEIANIATYCALDAPDSMNGTTIDANGARFVRYCRQAYRGHQLW